MNSNAYSFTNDSINSAKAAFADMVTTKKASEEAQRINNALVETCELSKKQFKQMQTTNELLVKQAKDSARDARISRWISIISLIVAIVMPLLCLLVNQKG